MKTGKNRTKKKDWQKADARILGQILAAQNIDFVLPDSAHIAEFFAETLIAIPGIAACRVCLREVSVQRGEMEIEICGACEASRAKSGMREEIHAFEPGFKCGLVRLPGMEFCPVASSFHHFGFFIFQVDDLDAFNIYKPFIDNLANYIALSLENRQQRDLLQKARDELERRVEERTEELRASNEKIQDLYNNAPCGYHSLDKDGFFVLVNDTELRWLGYSRDELIGKTTFWALLTKDSQKTFDENFPGFRERGFVSDLEFEMVRKDGSILPVLLNATAVTDRNGNYVMSRSTIFDNTKRKGVEQALRESEERLRQIASSLREVIWLRDAQTRQVLYVNPAFQKLTGRTCESFYENRDVVLDAVHPDDKEGVNIALDQRSESAYYDKEHRIIHTDGSIRWVSSRSFPVRNEAGEVYRWATIMEDITERKRNERELIILNSAINQSSDAVFLINEQLIFAYVNDAACRSLGYTREELLTMGPSDIDAVITYGAAENIMNKQFADGQYPRFETLHKTRDGHVFPVEISSSVVKYDGAKFSLTTVRDITERKQAEQALRENEEKFRTLIEQSAEGVMLADEDGNIVEWNHAYERITGLEQSQVLGKPIWDMMIKIIAPERVTEERIESIKAGILESLRTGKSPLFAAPSELEFYPISSREKHYLQQTIFPIKTEKGYRVASLIEDITERKRMIEALAAQEQKFRTLAENSPDNIARYDVNCRTIYINPTLERTLGLSASEMLGTTPTEVALIDENRKYEEKIAEVLKTGKPDEMDLVLPDIEGRIRYHNVRFVAERGADGAITGVQTIGRDVTERKQAEEALREGEERYRLLFHRSPVGVFHYNTQLYITDCNDRFAAILQSNRERLVGLDLKTLRDQSVSSALHRAAEGEEGLYEGLYHATTSSAKIQMSLRTAPLVDSQGRITGCIGIVEDITERKQAEEALRESEERYRLLVSLSPDAIGVHSEGRIEFANPAMVRLHGAKSEADIVGRSVLDFISPGSREFVKRRIEKARAIGETIPFTEEKFLRLDGTPVDVEVTSISYTSQGIPHIQVIARNITERKQHEREREAIIAVSTALRHATTRTEILSVILDQLINLFDADGAILVLPDPQTGGFIDEMGRGDVGKKMTGLNIPPGKGVCNWVVKNKKPYLNNHAEDDPLFYRPDLLGDSHCLASVPLITQDQTIGALWIARKVDILEQDLRLLNAIADIAANAIRRVMLHEQTEQQLNHLLALHQIDIAISNNFDSRVTLDVILSKVMDELEVNAVSILLLDPATHTLDYAAGIGFRTKGIERSHVKVGDGCAGCAAQECRTVLCLDIGQADGSFVRSSLLAGEEFMLHYATPLVVKGEVKGVLELFHRNTFEPEKEWLDYYETLATQAAIAIENASLLENLQRSNAELMLAYDATIAGWSRALDLRDRETEGHTQRVAQMALELAGKMGMSDTEKQDLWRGSLLHDIGKMGVPDSILLKPGPLTDGEKEVMQQHPVYAYQMLSPILYLKHALEISYCHHEKWDGSGYPRGLKGDEIPLSARVFAVVDVYDALTSDRAYRVAWPPEKAYRYIEEQAGRHFDPQVVKIFLESRPR